MRPINAKPEPRVHVSAERPPRADAQRNLEMLLKAANEIFAKQGVDAPVRDIAAHAGVGVGTLYRHFPRRADLIAAVFSHEIDSCADSAPRLAAQHPPLMALKLWLQEFVMLASTKRGLAQALHSGDPAFDFVPAKREQRLFPAFRMLFDAALSDGSISGDITAERFLNAAAMLCMSPDAVTPDQALEPVMLLVDGLQHRQSAEAVHTSNKTNGQ